MELDEALLDVVHGDGPQTEFAYRCAWARTRLRRIGAVDNSARGVWAITEAGRQIRSNDETKELAERQQKEYRSRPQGAGARAEDSNDADEDPWQAALLAVLRKIKPASFEGLCQRLLRSMASRG